MFTCVCILYSSDLSNLQIGNINNTLYFTKKLEKTFLFFQGLHQLLEMLGLGSKHAVEEEDDHHKRRRRSAEDLEALISKQSWVRLHRTNSIISVISSRNISN